MLTSERLIGALDALARTYDHVVIDAGAVPELAAERWHSSRRGRSWSRPSRQPRDVRHPESTPGLGIQRRDGVVGSAATAGCQQFGALGRGLIAVAFPLPRIILAHILENACRT